MNFFSNYIDSTCEIKKSNALYWPVAEINFLYKANNHIVGYYDDTFIKQKTYFSNNGLNQNTSFNRKLLVNNLVYSTEDLAAKRVFPFNRLDTRSLLLPFVSYFYAINDNFLNSDIFPLTYFRNNVYHFKNKQIFFSNYKFFKLKKQKNKGIMPFLKIASLNIKFIKNKKLSYVKPLNKIFYNNKFINFVQTPAIKMKRESWMIKRQYKLTFTKFGWLKFIKKDVDPFFKKVLYQDKHIRKAKRWAVRLNFEKFLSIQRLFLQFTTNLFILNFKSKWFIRNFLLYFAFLKNYTKFFKKNIMKLKVGGYRYNKKKKKKELKLRSVGPLIFKSPFFSLYYNYFVKFYNSWNKLVIYSQRLIQKLYLIKTNYFFSKSILELFFLYNSKYNLIINENRKEKWILKLSNNLILKSNKLHSFLRYNFISSFQFLSNIIFNQSFNNIINKNRFLNNFISFKIFNNFTIYYYFVKFKKFYNFIIFELYFKTKIEKLNAMTKKNYFLSNFFTIIDYSYFRLNSFIGLYLGWITSPGLFWYKISKSIYKIYTLKNTRNINEYKLRKKLFKFKFLGWRKKLTIKERYLFKRLINYLSRETRSQIKKKMKKRKKKKMKRKMKIRIKTKREKLKSKFTKNKWSFIFYKIMQRESLSSIIKYISRKRKISKKCALRLSIERKEKRHLRWLKKTNKKKWLQIKNKKNNNDSKPLLIKQELKKNSELWFNHIGLNKKYYNSKL